MTTSTEERKVLGKIERADLGIEDHGIFGFSIEFNLGGAHQATGWYNLQNEWGGELQKAILQAAGVRLWSELVGKTFYVIYLGDERASLIAGFEKLPTERQGGRLIFKEFFTERGIK